MGFGICIVRNYTSSSGPANGLVTGAALEGINEGRNEGRNEAKSEAINEAINDTVNCRQISFATLSRHHPVTLPPVGGITVGLMSV